MKPATRRVSLLIASLVGCAVPRGGLPEFDDSDAGVDASMDGDILDSSVDVPGVDAPGVDAPMTDAGDDAFDAEIDSGCGAVGVRSCAGSMLQECTPAGLADVRECLRGCASGACTAYDVRNVPLDRLLHTGTAGLTVEDGQTVVLDTDTGEITLDPDVQLRPPGVGVMNGISYEREGQTGAPGLAIFSFDSLLVASGGTLRARGSDVPVILVGGDATIHGTIDVSASGRIGGVGGSDGGNHGSNGGGGAAGGEVGEADGLSFGGGGGGGHSANGGGGGNDGSAGGGQGGMVIADSGGTPLVGGGGGGGGATAFGDGSHGGGGGGAVQVSAGTSLTVSGSGIVRASGAGGDAGWSSGGGGGAGGSIVLEAPTLQIDGIVVSNGGGGGGGLPALGSAESGENGRDDTDRARGGDGSGGGKNGGPGGSADDLTGGGGQNGAPAGGGGGAAGRVSFYTEGGAPSVSGVVSPDPIMGAIP